jgi:hypothetical protein
VLQLHLLVTIEVQRGQHSVSRHVHVRSVCCAAVQQQRLSFWSCVVGHHAFQPGMLCKLLKDKRNC